MAIERDHPYGQFHFLVEINGVGTAGFSEVSGLSAEVDMIEYRTGASPEYTPIKIPGLTRFSDVTLRRGVVGSLELWDWIRQTQVGLPDAARQVVISLLNEEHEPAMSWRLDSARPIRHTSGPLIALGDDVAIEELVLAHEGLSIS